MLYTITAAGLADGQEFQPLALFIHLKKKIDTVAYHVADTVLRNQKIIKRQCLYSYVTQSRRNGKENINKEMNSRPLNLQCRTHNSN